MTGPWTILLRSYVGKDPELDGVQLRQVYAELRAIAERIFRRERGAQTLQPTALVHEALLNLGSQHTPPRGRAEFLAASARAMRRILVDRARRRRFLSDCLGLLGRETVTAVPTRRDELIDLDECLNDLAHENPELARIVELRWFLGSSLEETALALDLSTRTVKRKWQLALAWLQRRLEEREHEHGTLG